MEDMNQQKTNPGRKKKILLGLFLALIIFAGIAGFAYRSKQQSTYQRYEFDTTAIEGRIQTMSEEEIQAELNRIVEEGMFNISIASAIIYDLETKRAEARIENIAANHYHMQVEIILEETGETIYSSGLIKPGYSIEYIEFNKELAAGEYAARAVFHAITAEDQLLFGTSAAELKIYALNPRK